MSEQEQGQERGFEMVEQVSNTALATITKSELQTAIEIAKTYPRSISRFQREVRDLATMNEDVAEECLYALPRTDREGKTVNIEGPSIRMAEIVMSAWGNCRVLTRVLDTEGDVVVAQGIFMDLERVTVVSKEVSRRITNKFGKRYSTDMITVTSNAAASIAARNAILAGIPKAIWNSAYEDAKKVAVGTLETLEHRRSGAMQFLAGKGVNEARVFAALEVTGLDDIGLEKLATLRGLVSSVKTGESSLSQAFPVAGKDAPAEEPAQQKGVAGVKAAAMKAKAEKAE
jgi:hypothetical protein